MLGGGCAPTLAGTAPPARTTSPSTVAAPAPTGSASISTGAAAPLVGGPEPAPALPPGVGVYGPPAIEELRRRLAPDPLRDALVVEARRLARASHRPEPVDDARLDMAMNALARRQRGMELPSFELVDFLLGHFGLAEPAPQLSFARATEQSDAEIRDQMSGQLATFLAQIRAARIGVGIYRRPGDVMVVVGLQESNVELAPVPRTMPAGGATVVAGRLLEGRRRPEVIVTGPDGQVRELAAATDATDVGFQAPLRCDRGRGRYQIEVTGDDALGSGVVANFPVFCGVLPPREPPRGTPVPPGTPATGAEAEARVLTLMNRDRSAAGLPPLVLDPHLSEVARAHSRDMDEHDFVGHVSPTTGDALARVRRAGFSPSWLLENVARAYSPEEAEAGLMSSPGHRENILDRRVTRVGIGVVLGKPVSGIRPLLVTQVFL